MLLQTAMQDGLVATDDLAPEAGVMSEAASEAIDVLLDRELQAAEGADESACRRYYEGHAAQFMRCDAEFWIKPGQYRMSECRKHSAHATERQ